MERRESIRSEDVQYSIHVKEQNWSEWIRRRGASSREPRVRGRWNGYTVVVSLCVPRASFTYHSAAASMTLDGHSHVLPGGFQAMSTLCGSHHLPLDRRRVPLVRSKCATKKATVELSCPFVRYFTRCFLFSVVFFLSCLAGHPLHACVGLFPGVSYLKWRFLPFLPARIRRREVGRGFRETPSNRPRSCLDCSFVTRIVVSLQDCPLQAKMPFNTVSAVASSHPLCATTSGQQFGISSISETRAPGAMLAVPRDLWTRSARRVTLETGCFGARSTSSATVPLNEATGARRVQCRSGFSSASVLSETRSSWKTPKTPLRRLATAS